jgi:hypothetical protein
MATDPPVPVPVVELPAEVPAEDNEESLVGPAAPPPATTGLYWTVLEEGTHAPEGACRRNM